MLPPAKIKLTHSCTYSQMKHIHAHKSTPMSTRRSVLVEILFVCLRAKGFECQFTFREYNVTVIVAIYSFERLLSCALLYKSQLHKVNPLVLYFVCTLQNVCIFGYMIYIYVIYIYRQFPYFPDLFKSQKRLLIHKNSVSCST